jgi:hypothetical protein
MTMDNIPDTQVQVAETVVRDELALGNLLTSRGIYGNLHKALADQGVKEIKERGSATITPMEDDDSGESLIQIGDNMPYAVRC